MCGVSAWYRDGRVMGETIKDFKLIQRLGEGGMGEVWMAEQQIIQTRVAIKLLRAEISTNRQHVERFFNEAVAVGKIKHAGIVKIFDVGFHAGRAFLIMEFLEGEPLASRIRRAGRLLIGDAAEIGRQIASILEATHVERVIHRDLKPDNVFLTPDAEVRERVKILDFGIAKLGLGLTSTGDRMGTPAYMPPEQWDNAANAGAPADVYSFGCLVFEMCCGRPPFEAASIGEAYKQHAHDLPPRASALVPGVPRELDELIVRMLAKSPEGRPAIREVGAALARIAAAHPRALDTTAPPEMGPARVGGDVESTFHIAVSSGDVPGTPDRGRKRRRGLTFAIVAVAGIGAVISVGAVIATGGGPARPDAGVPPPVDAPSGPKPEPSANRWVRIDPPVALYALGVTDKAPPQHLGFRPSAERPIVTPAQPYAIQEHEVTWAELEPWLAATGARIERPPWADDAAKRTRLPATGVTWSIARDYCQSLGGALPTEEQWEYAARGPERRPNPWGTDPLDLLMTRAYAGPDAAPLPVMTSLQDRTPPVTGGLPIWDLAGNAQEWTLGLWRGDRPGQDEADVQQGETSIRAVRGLPLTEAPPPAIQPVSAAYRDRLCATGPCVEKARRLLSSVGFRCVKSLDE